MTPRAEIPFMVDAKRSPVDFKQLDPTHVSACAVRGRCGVCGKRIKHGPIAFIGPDDGRTCFADPWMHPACAERAMQRCPFLNGRRDWSDAESRGNPLLTPFSAGMVVMLATNWRAHREFGAWHFQAIGPLTKALPQLSLLGGSGDREAAS